MLKGKTSTGFEFEIDKRVLNDYELIEVLDEAEQNPLRITKVLTKLFGNDGKHELIEHVREEDGFVPVDKLMAEFTEIMKSGQQTKNS